MFPLTAPQRRLVCRAAFLTLAFAPTLWIGSWALAWNLPSHARGYRHALAGLTGRHVEFRRMVHARPGVTRLHDVELRHPETGDVILTADVLEATTSGSRLDIALDRACCQAGGLAELISALSEQLSGRWETAGAEHQLSEIRVLPSQWILASADSGAQTLDDVAIELRMHEAGPQAQLWFRFPDRNRESAAPNDARISVVWARNRDVVPPTTSLVLDTGAAHLPCPLLAALVPEVALLGSQATFHGSVRLREDADGWHGTIAGDLRRVPLKQLVGGGSGRILSGQADFIDTSVTLAGGHIVTAGARLTSPSGTVSRKLLEALAGCDGMDVRLPSDRHEIYQYNGLSCTAQLAVEGVWLTAAAGNGAIMSDVNGAPLILDTAGSVEPLALAVALMPECDVMVPATPATATVMQWLPLPPTTRSTSPSERIAAPNASIKTIRPHRDTD
ncbi:MAG: hypothetical protein R3C10_24725 [Pirellulales bacterium]